MGLDGSVDATCLNFAGWTVGLEFGKMASGMEDAMSGKDKRRIARLIAKAAAAGIGATAPEGSEGTAGEEKRLSITRNVI